MAEHVLSNIHSAIVNERVFTIRREPEMIKKLPSLHFQYLGMIYRMKRVGIEEIGITNCRMVTIFEVMNIKFT